MIYRELWGVGTVIIFAVIATAIVASGNSELRAQSSADSFGNLLRELEASNTRATIEFAQVAPRLGRTVDIGEGTVLVDRVGADMICFVVPGTTLDQITCVPFSNITSVIYSERP